MEVIDCYWEEVNLGEKTCELDISEAVLPVTEIQDLVPKYKYMVIKTGTGNLPFYRDLSAIGFYFVENQISLSVNSALINKNDIVINKFLNKASIEECRSMTDLEEILKNIDDSMFSTDRIALDDYYGTAIANRRYKNWIRTSFEQSQIHIMKIMYKGQNVGFGMLKDEGHKIDYLLGGIFSEYKMLGTGILVPLVPYMYLLKDERRAMIATKVSSNNLDVLKCYMNCNYNMVDMKYIFVRHN